MNTDTRWFRALLFGSVYFIEGAILTYFSGFNAIYLRQYNLSFSQIGIATAVALIPFIIKIFIGMLSDKVSLFGRGHRKPYMVIGILMQGVGLLLLPLINPGVSFASYMVVLLVISLGMSTYDTTSDGLAIDSTPQQERGFVQGMMVGGRALGQIMLATVVGILVSRVSWNAAFCLVGAVTFLPLILVLQVREPARTPEKEFAAAGFRSFLTPVMGMFVALGMLYPLVLFGTNGMLGAFLNEQVHLDMAQVGLFTSLFGIGAVVGGIAGGPLTDRWGRRTSLLVALGVTSLAMLLLAITTSAALAVGAVLVFGVAYGYYDTVYMAAGMDMCDPRIAATMFAIIMAMGNVGIALGQTVAGLLIDGVGFSGMFLAMCAINVATLPLIPLIFKRRQTPGACTDLR